MAASIPVIAGCTATGKSSLALKLAERYTGIEIISADSRQFYRGMDIGTAKPSREELALVPHHMIDVAEPDTLLSAGWFASAAMEIIQDVLARGGIPLVVGGSALYIMHLAGLVDRLPPRNDSLRNALGSIEDTCPGSLHRLLSGLDSAEAKRTGEQDRIRLVRALEIAIQSGQMPSALKTGGSADERFRFALLEQDNTTLRKRISLRAAGMVENGLVQEVKGLLESGVPGDPVLSATIGYAEILSYLRGESSLEGAVEQIGTNTWRYARRQRNMFRRLPGAIRVNGDIDSVSQVLFEGGNSSG